jgi:hypothetical protein
VPLDLDDVGVRMSLATRDAGIQAALGLLKGRKSRSTQSLASASGSRSRK